ncbi:MAG: hypothetical protein K2H09_02820 [Treponemataceae bacterium]|nr:hypothetical protein [Treponemataceae bacterium]
MEIGRWGRAVVAAARVVEAVYFVLSAAMAALAVASFVMKDSLGGMIVMSNGGDASIGTNGFQISIADGSGNVIPAEVTVFAFAGLFSMFCMAMIFRNVRLIFKIAENGGGRADGESFFCGDVIRMVREIGLFSIAVPVVGICADIAGRLAVGGALEASVQMYGFAFGFVVLCLSQFFAYGADLEREVEGLV